MAKVTKIIASKSVRISKNYNSLEANYGMEVELDDNDDFKAVKEHVLETIDNELAKQIQELDATLTQLA